MKKYFFLLCLVFFAAACSKSPAVLGATTPSPTPVVTVYNEQMIVGGQTLNVEVATTPAVMQQGLSYRSSMEQNQGMLFDFSVMDPNGAAPAFWMKDMNFNLDFIWIYKNKIVGITADVAAPPKISASTYNDTNLQLYNPPSVINQVLEVNAGWAAANNVKVGDAAELVTASR